MSRSELHASRFAFSRQENAAEGWMTVGNSTKMPIRTPSTGLPPRSAKGSGNERGLREPEAFARAIGRKSRFAWVWAFAAVLLANLAFGSFAEAQADKNTSPWVGKKVVFSRDGVNLKVQNQVVVTADGTFRVYTVKLAQGGWLWVTASGVNKDVLVPDPKEGIAGWVKVSDVVAKDDAIAFFTGVLQRNDNDWFAHYMRGGLYDEQKEFDKSFADKDACVRLRPDSPASYNNRGAAWSSKKDYDKAIADYNKAIEIDPKSVYAYTNRGDARREKKDYDKAAADINTALEIDPKFAWAFFYRARVWRDQGMFAKAIADFEKAIEIDDNWDNMEDPRNELGRLLATCDDDKVRDGKRAVELATKACELSKWKEPNSIDTLAAAYAEVGNFDEAVKRESEAVDLLTDASQIAEFTARLKLYREKKPYRAAP